MFITLKWIIKSIFLHSTLTSIDGVTLTPRTVDVWQDKEVTLNCSDHARYLAAVQWKVSSITAAVEYKNNYCKGYGFLLDNIAYSYSCTNNTSFSLTLRKISRSMHTSKWKCLDADLNESNIVTIYVKVSAMNATIFPNTKVFTVEENKSFSTLQCMSSESRPEPNFFWYKDNNTDSREDDILLEEYVNGSTASDTIKSYNNTFSSTLNRTMNGWYLFCGTNNGMSDTIISDKILLNITYPPDIAPVIVGLENGVEYIVTEGNFVNLTCSVTGGYPLPSLQWNKNKRTSQALNGSTVTNTISWQASREDQGDLTCTSNHINKDERKSVHIIVLYPPDKPSISIMTSAGKFRTVMDTIHVTEQTQFTIYCSANSNPPVSVFEWSGLSQSNGSLLNITKEDRSESTVTCKVINHMKETKSGETVSGTNSTTLQVNVLYPPTVNILSGNTRTITEGDNFVYSCNVTQGNPNVTGVKWTWGNQTWYGHYLTLHNVSRNETGVYQCCAHNTMISSDSTTVVGEHCANIQLNVEYADTSESFQLGLSAIGAIGSARLLVVVFVVLAVYKKRYKGGVKQKRISTFHEKKEEHIYQNVNTDR